MTGIDDVTEPPAPLEPPGRSGPPGPAEPPDPAPAERFGRVRSWSVGLGVVVVVIGVLLHLPDLAAMPGIGGQAEMPDSGMSGMAMTWTVEMVTGMALLVVGLVLTWIGAFAGRRATPTTPLSVTIEHGRPRPIYWVTCCVLVFALIIDTMKPLTLSFVLPGMSDEYGISIASASTLNVVALTGTTVGSVVWGMLGDRFGRRAPLVLATVLFIATSVCGAMPSFTWNLVMCFTMGMSAGGMLPLVFTLLAEMTPSSHRRWMAVTIGAAGGLAGYIAASGAASLLEPLFTWRALWLIGLPTGLLLFAVLPLIPESPMFLLRTGRRSDAEAVLARFGARLVVRPPTADGVAEAASNGGWRALLRGRVAITAAVALIGVNWGLVNFGFIGLLPAQLSEAGMASTTTSAMLARAALYSAPALLVVIVLYAVWSSRGSLITSVAASALGLIGVGLWALVGGGEAMLVGAVGLVVLTLAAVNAILVPYSTEIYPTAFRARGASLAAASAKLGGVLGPVTMLIILRVGAPGLATLTVSAALFGVLSLVGAALMLWLRPRNRVLTTG